MSLASAVVTATVLTIGGDFFVTEEHRATPLGEGAVVVNLEGALCPDRPDGRARRVNGKWQLCIHLERTVSQLKAAKVSAVIRVNNHADDGGEDGERLLRERLTKEGIAVVDKERSFCVESGAARRCLHVIEHNTDLTERLKTLPADAKFNDIFVQHVVGPDDAPSAFGRNLVGIGLHKPGELQVARDPSGRPVLRAGDLADVALDCRCADGRVGVLVDFPVPIDRAPIKIRVIRTAKKSGEPIGAPAEDQTRELLKLTNSWEPIVLVDDHLEVWRLKRAASRPASRRAPAPLILPF